MNSRPARLLALMAAATLVVAGCAPSQNSSGGGEEDNGSTDSTADEASGEPVKVGIIYSETGPLAPTASSTGRAWRPASTTPPTAPAR